MRPFIIVSFVLLSIVVNATSAYALPTCPEGTPQDADSKYYYQDSNENSFECELRGNTSGQPIGAGCQYQTDCSSGFCDGATGTCKAGGLQTTGPGNINPTTRGPGNTGSGVTLINPLGTSCNSSNSDCVGAFLTSILKFVVRIGSIIVILMLVYVGFLFVVAQGKEEKIREARGALLWTVVGALILLGAQAIALGIQATVSSLGG